MILRYETIAAAVSGDRNAFEEVIREYEPLMMFLSILVVRDENGNERRYFSEDALQMLRQKLTEAIPKWKEILL